MVGLGRDQPRVALIIVDTTIVTVPSRRSSPIWASPRLRRSGAGDLHLDLATLLLVSGRLADQYGRRWVFALGAGVFAAASVLAAVATSGNLLILARALQGVGGAMMLPTSLSLLNANFRGRDRGIAFGIWGATIGGMAALGPLLGGWLTTDFSWRWAFGINIPLCLVVIIGLYALVPESRDPQHRRGVDWSGAVLSALGVGGIVFGLIEGRTYGWLTSTASFTVAGWTWPWTVSPIAVASFWGSQRCSSSCSCRRIANRRAR